MNAYRGETPFVVGDNTYTLRLTTNVLAAVESALDKRGPALVSVLLIGGVEALRAVFWAALTTPSRGEAQIPAPARGPVTLEAIGDLIDEVGIDKAGKVYWVLMVNGGIVERAGAEEAGLVPPLEGPVPKGPAVPALPLEPPSAPIEVSI